MKLRDLVEPAAPGAGPVRWLVLESRLLDGERVVLVLDKRDLPAARQAHPDLVCYCLPELEELDRHHGGPDDAALVRTIHQLKRQFRGWIVPADSPRGRWLAARTERNGHGTSSDTSRR